MRFIHRRAAPAPVAVDTAQVAANIRAYAAGAPDRHRAFLQRTEELAHRVVNAVDGPATYEVACEFFEFAALESRSQTEASELAYILPCLLDAMDAARGLEGERESVLEMKRAAQEWLAALPAPGRRREYLARWTAEVTHQDE